MANSNPCIICEKYIKGRKCEKVECPVAIMKAENKKLKDEKRKLKKELEELKFNLSWGRKPCIGDRHEMGCW